MPPALARHGRRKQSVIAVDLNTATACVELPVLPHTPMSSHVLLQSDGDSFTEHVLEMARSPRHPPMAQLVRAFTRSTALAAFTRVPTM